MACPNANTCEEVLKLSTSVSKLANALTELIEENKKIRSLLSEASGEIKKLRQQLAELADYDPTQDSGRRSGLYATSIPKA